MTRFCAVGFSPGPVGHRLTIGRGRWSSGQSDVQRLKAWTVPGELPPVVLGFVPGEEPELWVHIPSQDAGPATRLIASAGLPTLNVLTPSWLPVRTLAMTRDAKGVRGVSRNVAMASSSRHFSTANWWIRFP